MPLVKRLFIKASDNYEKGFRIVPINSMEPIEIESSIGKFKVILNIRNFDGSKPHLSNSSYNLHDELLLNGEKRISNTPRAVPPENELHIPNLRLIIEFIPNQNINGGELIFGNDFTYPIRDYVPTSVLNTGLKLFTWLVTDSIKGEVSNDKPYIYGMAVNGFTYMGIDNFNQIPLVINNKKRPINCQENLVEQDKRIPQDSKGRIKYFGSMQTCKSFTFRAGIPYTLQFDTDYMKLADSRYAVSIPKFDFDVTGYANEKFNNFNWTIKKGGLQSVDEGIPGLIINFALLDEEEEREET
ncbi:uncharacterized protein J8A68_003796 [[Candida] subhashii]|uniref:Domain of unknown function at the cortex 1 domain-containing protein n=1 Tax=[Candida] subhashii TaxID=561895 RepID=A0A8J5QL99_9ASCO|nr:uncharacterized protein J8A68_003796 [[Candida] subhashii]KAG7662666.1 hypothetical protein J8A68_003796 [[Candida] subhashii]